MTGQCPKTGQRLVDAVTVDQSSDSHFDTGGDVRVASQRCFPEREAGADALASRAQETPSKHHCREGGKAKTSAGRRTVERQRSHCSIAVAHARLELHGELDVDMRDQFHFVRRPCRPSTGNAAQASRAYREGGKAKKSAGRRTVEL